MFLSWNNVYGKGMLTNLTTADKQTIQHLLLAIYIIQHKFQLGTILGSIVCFATHKSVTTLANIIDFPSSKFGDLRHGTGLKHIACHTGTNLSRSNRCFYDTRWG